MSSTVDFTELIHKFPARLTGFVYLCQQPDGEEVLRQVYSRSGFEEAMDQLRDASNDPAQVHLSRVQVP